MLTITPMEQFAHRVYSANYKAIKYEYASNIPYAYEHRLAEICYREEHIYLIDIFLVFALVKHESSSYKANKLNLISYINYRLTPSVPELITTHMYDIIKCRQEANFYIVYNLTCKLIDTIQKDNFFQLFKII